MQLTGYDRPLLERRRNVSLASLRSDMRRSANGPFTPIPDVDRLFAAVLISEFRLLIVFAHDDELAAHNTDFARPFPRDGQHHVIRDEAHG